MFKEVHQPGVFVEQGLKG